MSTPLKGQKETWPNWTWPQAIARVSVSPIQPCLVFLSSPESEEDQRRYLLCILVVGHLALGIQQGKRYKASGGFDGAQGTQDGE